ncbi:hypothetical protein B0H15DRAFT_855879, partial [Mycena belliarum]
PPPRSRVHRPTRGFAGGIACAAQTAAARGRVRGRISVGGTRVCIALMCTSAVVTREDVRGAAYVEGGIPYATAINPLVTVRRGRRGRHGHAAAATHGELRLLEPAQLLRPPTLTREDVRGARHGEHPRRHAADSAGACAPEPVRPRRRSTREVIPRALDVWRELQWEERGCSWCS